MRLIDSLIYKRISNRPELVRIAENMSWLFFEKLMRLGIGVVVGVEIARYLGPEQFGLLNFSIAFVGIFSIVAGLGMQHIVVKELVGDDLERGKVLGSTALMLLLGGLFSYILLVSIILWLRPEDVIAKLMVAIIGSSLIFKAGDVVVYWFESQVESKNVVKFQNFVFVIFAAIKICLVFFKCEIIYFAVAILAETSVASLSLMWILFGKLSKSIGIRTDFKCSILLVKKSWSMLLTSILMMLSLKLDILLLGQMANDGDVGIYSAASRVCEVWYFIPIVIVGSVFPSIIKSKKREIKILENRIKLLYAVITWAGLVIAIPITLFADSIILALYSQKYMGAVDVLAVQAIAIVFVFLTVVSNRILIADGRQDLVLLRSILGLIINVSANLLLIPHFGPVGAASAMVITQLSTAVIFDVLSKSTRQLLVLKLSAVNPLYVIKVLKNA